MTSKQTVDLPDLYVLHWNRLAPASVKRKKKKKVKKTIAPVSLNGCQPSISDTWARTKQLSPCWREKTHRYGGRGRSKASVTEHKDILIQPNAAAGGFIKKPSTTSPSLEGERDVTTL